MAAAKVAVVTGGERGVGRGIVETLLSDGWQVIAAGIDVEAGRLLEAQVEGALFEVCDVGDEAAVSVLFERIRERYGRLDGLVLNAGIASPKRVDLDALALEDWEAVLRVNLTGPFLCAKHAAGLLKDSRGSIVSIASTRATMSEANTFAYSASKGGVVALTHSLAASLGPEVRVNAVSPGWIETGDDGALSDSDHSQHLVGRVGRPKDIGEMVAFLLGEKSGFVTGQNFVVDGGMTKKMIYEE